MSEPTIGEIKGRYPALVEMTNAEGDLAYRARVELLVLWGVFDKPDESAEIERLRRIETVLRNTPGNMPPPVVDYLRFLSSFTPEWGAKYLRDLADALEVEP